MTSSSCPARWVEVGLLKNSFQAQNIRDLFVKRISFFLISPILHAPPLCIQCLGQEVNLLIDTGCKLNLMSSVTAERFG